MSDNKRQLGVTEIPRSLDKYLTTRFQFLELVSKLVSKQNNNRAQHRLYIYIYIYEILFYLRTHV